MLMGSSLRWCARMDSSTTASGSAVAAGSRRERSSVAAPCWRVSGVGGPVDDRVATPVCGLGALAIARGGEPTRLGSRQQRRLLAVLVIHANEVVSTDRLVDVLWGEDSPASSMHSLQTLLSRLRATLGEGRLETCPPGY